MTVEYTLRRTRQPARYPNRIREYRIRAGLSQERLARALGHGRSVLSTWERGRCLPNLANALHLARSLSTLIEGLYWDLYRPRPDRAAIAEKPKP